MMWKNQNNNKIIVLLIAIVIVSVSIFLGLNKEKEIYGKIVETTVSDKGLVSFVICTDTGKDMSVHITDETFVFSFLKSVDENQFKSGMINDLEVSVTYKGLPSSYKMQDGKKIKAFDALSIEILEVLSEEILLFDDTKIEIWDCVFNTVYRLQDGTELLDVRGSSGPDHVQVGGIDSFDDLTKEAQKNVLHYYENQGILYDVQAELTRAYDVYRKLEDKSAFSAYFLEQSIVPVASNESVMYFLTSVYLPKNHNTYYEYRIGATFDRKTGENINNLDIFSCSKDEVIEKILDIAGINDITLRKEMSSAFKAECIIVFPDHIEIHFDEGTLPSQDYSYSMGLDYNDALISILHDWAIPKDRY